MSLDERVLGVDFGTSNTAAVVRWSDDQVTPVLFDGMPQLPSAVALDASSRLLVGRDALYVVRTDPERVELYPKQRIDDSTVLLGGTEVAVEDLIGAVLGRVGAEAARLLGGPPRRVVLTVPAGWGPQRKGILRSAAERVFGHVELVVEPVAAASYFVAVVRNEVPLDAPIVVYDLGAGTFDVAVVRRSADGFVVLAADGLPDAGGLDIDATIVGHLGATVGARDPERWRRLTRPESDVDRRLSRQLWDDVRGAKEVLSRATTARIPLPLFDDDVPLGREQFDALARPVLGRTVAATRGVLRTAGVGAAEIAGIQLVGGSSRIPLVATLLHQSFGIPPTVVEQPELAVAEGSLRVGSTSPTPVPDGDGWPVGSGNTAEMISSTGAVPAGRPWHRGWLRAGLALLVAMLLGVAIAVWISVSQRADGSDTSDDPSSGGSATSTPTPTFTAASPSVSPTPMTAAGCVVGTWRVTRIQYEPTNYYGTMVAMSGGGSIYTYRPDGTAQVVMKNVTYTGRANGSTYTETHNGRLAWRYRVGNGKIIYTDGTTSGTAVIKVNGRVRARNQLEAAKGSSSVDFACDATGMSVSGSTFSIELARQP